jgi:hypothetical protein
MAEEKRIFSWMNVAERTTKPRTAGINMVMALHIAIEGHEHARRPRRLGGRLHRLLQSWE